MRPTAARRKERSADSRPGSRPGKALRDRNCDPVGGTAASPALGPSRFARQTAGDTVTYTAPNGKELQVEIVDAVPYSA